MAETFPVHLGSRLFTFADQRRFAELSGDANPLHLDKIAARRSLVGGIAVHGVHTLLFGLDALARSRFRPAGIASLDVRFPKPVSLGDEVGWWLRSAGEREMSMSANVGTRIVATLRLALGPASQVGPDSFLTEQLKTRDRPDHLAFAEIADRSGTVAFAAPAVSFTEAFPAAAALLSGSRLRDIAACSTLVGMHCPGLHSIFSRLSLQWSDEQASQALRWRVTSSDDRFNLVRIDVSGNGLAGKIEAFSPPPPPAQLSMAALGERIVPREFAKQRALVIGGSRGLGELTAKALAAGGGDVILTYATGTADAERVATEIVAAGGKADALPYDVTAPASEQLDRYAGRTPTHLYYYATCQIFGARSRAFNYELLARFLAFYVYGFHDLCQGLAARGATQLTIFCPSSIAVEERPASLTEYAMAKAASEILCADLPAIIPGATVYCDRLPRLLTDQTAVITPQELPKTIDVILPILRRMQ